MKKIISTIVASLILGITHVSMATLDSNSIVLDDIEYYIRTDKSIYSLGEGVDVLYSVTNLKDEEWTFGYIPPVMDIIVAAKVGENFEEIWYWSWDKTYPGGPIVFSLEPDGSTEINEIWSQIDLNGAVQIEDHNQVPPGIYRISGNFYPTDSSVSVDISIVPEPATILILGFGGLFLRKKK